MKVFLKKKYSLKLKIYLIIIIFSILLITINLLVYYNKTVTPKLNDYSYDLVNKFTYQLIMDYLNDELITSDDLKDILILTKNNNDEIILVDFNLDKAYEVNSKITNTLKEKINSFESGVVLDNDLGVKSARGGLEVDIPIFINSNYALFSTYGPKIPVKISFIGTIETNLKTDVSSYGMNNSLAQISAEINVVESIITPIDSKNINLNYNILLDSKLINGRVPAYYNGSTISKQSMAVIKKY